jgi:hypothetical protein
MRWTFDDATGRHLWAVQLDYGVTANGALVASPCGDRFRFETLRTLKRLTEAHDAPDASKTVLARASYEIVQTQILSTAPPAAEIICQKLLFGEPGREAREQLNADSLSDFIHQTSAGFKALGALKSQQGVTWQADSEQKGQLHLRARDVNVLVWSYPGPAIRMRQTLQRWRSELATSRPLVIFEKSAGTLYPTPHETSVRRHDVGEAPPSRRRGADEPVATALIVECSLDDIENCFDTEVAADFVAAVGAQIAAAVETVSADGAMHVV